jgi:WD40 repeat protein
MVSEAASEVYLLSHSLVNFLGPSDEFVVSGSDDGNWFMWRKSTGSLCGIYHGDQRVVNVIEGHPHLPLVAVSGIDYTVKVRTALGICSKLHRSFSAFRARTRSQLGV